MEFLKNNQFKIAAVVVSLLIICIVALFTFPKDKNDNNNNNNEVYYTVTFDSDGGSLVNMQSVLEGGKISEPIIPVKEGYNFLGWYIGSRKYDFDNTIYQDIKLEAKWEKIDGEDNNTDLENEEDKQEDNTEKEDSQVNKPSNNSGNNDNKPTTSDKVSVTGVTLNKSSLTLNVGDSSTLVATVKPDNATNKNVSWFSSNKNVVTVNNGKVTAVGEGSAVITASVDGKEIKCTVTVNKIKDSTVEVTSVTLNKTSLSLNVGDSDTLVATVNPSNATNKNVSWSSSNNGVVTVNNGAIKAVGEGSAVITVSAGGKEVKCTVTVKKAVTYSTQWERIESSSLGEYYLYIVSSEGKKVSGRVKVTYLGGGTKEQEVSSGGLKLIKSAVQSVDVINAN